MAWKVRSPSAFALGIVALIGAVVTGILPFTVVPCPVAVPDLLCGSVIILGAVLFFGGFALLATGVQRR